MKNQFKRTISKLLAVVVLLTAAICGNAQNNNQANPKQQAAQLREKWSKALGKALRDSRAKDDEPSATFVSNMLISLNQPGGMSPAALEANGLILENKMRELVKQGELERGAIFQSVIYNVSLDKHPTGCAHPSLKTGGTPGPGGLVLYLPFDKPEKAGLIHDESGAGNDGHVFGAKWVADGKFGGAYHFSITNLSDRIVITNSDTLNPDFITISAWIKTADKDGFWNRIVDKECFNAYCLNLGGDWNDKNFRAKLLFESSRGQLCSDRGLALDDNQWHQVAGVYDGSTIYCYVDGVGQKQPVRYPGPLKKSGWDLCIGNGVADFGLQEILAFDGLIDEVRIYNRALSADEIKLLATATRAGADVVPPPTEATNKPIAAERLKKVKSLFEQGLINKEDYHKKVKEIMESL